MTSILKNALLNTWTEKKNDLLFSCSILGLADNIRAQDLGTILELIRCKG